MTLVKNCKISYIISTRNRLPFLKILEKHIFSRLNADEELIVIDGDSSDGSKEYLQDLYDKGIIHQFISEPDINQAHGWNKALLMAKGEIVKKIIDDDVHDLTAIRKCADYMLSNPKVELLISNCLNSWIASPDNLQSVGNLNRFFQYKEGKIHCFPFSDVYLLIRRSTLSKFGLFDTQYHMMDWEYSLRCTYLKACIAYYTGYNSLAVSTPGNVTSTTAKSIKKREGLIGKVKYGYPGDRFDISLYSEFKIFIGKSLKLIKNIFSKSPALNNISMPDDERLMEIYDKFYECIKEKNQAGDFKYYIS